MNATEEAPAMKVRALAAIRHLETVTDTVYPGRNGRWWYEEWGGLGLCEREHGWLKKSVQPCDECAAAAAEACDYLDANVSAL